MDVTFLNYSVVMLLAPYWVGATSSLVGPTHWQSVAAHLAASLGSSTLEVAIKLCLPVSDATGSNYECSQVPSLGALGCHWLIFDRMPVSD